MARPELKGDPIRESDVVSKSAYRAATNLGLTNKTLGDIIGVSEASVSRLKQGTYRLARGSKEFELGVLFVRLYRSLDAIVGGDGTVASAWLHNHNTVLGGAPLEIIKKVQGLVDVINYLDSRRAVL